MGREEGGGRAGVIEEGELMRNLTRPILVEEKYY